MALSAGSRLGPYEVVAPLGSGGMGEVYRALDPRLDREVAIKVLPRSAREDPQARARFRREALALSRLNHPHIEMVLDLGEAGGVDYLVLELVPGETLAVRVSRGRVPEREAAELGAQVAEALAEAHERGVFHRDLKPWNIMVTPKGRVKVLDFGLAKVSPAAGDETRSLDLTREGTTAGALAYMAPEQLLGEPIDARADLYALGVVLYEMTTAKRPFQAAIATALANEVLHGRLAPPRAHEPSLTPRAEAVILRAMERERSRRYQTAGEMLGELRRLSAADAGDSGDTSAATTARRVTSIAVLPLENLSGDPSQEYFSDGMTEELIACLAQVRSLRIISRTSVMRYKGQRKSIPDIARELNVDAVVEGSVRRAGERVRITAQLIDAATERHLWARSFERDLKEVLAHVGVADAYNLMGFMTVLPPRETFPRAQAAARRALEIHPSSAEALTSLAYAALWHDWDFEESERLFREAIDLDPKYSQAHLWFGNVLTLSGRAEEAYAEAYVARTLDPLSNIAIAFGGWFRYWRGRFEEALGKFQDVIPLIPGFGPLHYWMGLAFARAGRDAEAMAALARGVELLGRTPQALSALATGHALAGRGGEARALLAEIDAQSAHRYVAAYYPAQVWVALGEYDAAFAALERAFDERVHWLAGIRMDPSLAALRQDPRFEILAARVEG